MTKQRKKYLDDLWLNSEVGCWARAEASEKKEDAQNILQTLFEKGHLNPLDYLMTQEKEMYQKVKSELTDPNEGKEYMLELERDSCDLLDIMVAYEFSMLDLYMDI